MLIGEAEQRTVNQFLKGTRFNEGGQIFGYEGFSDKGGLNRPKSVWKWRRQSDEKWGRENVLTKVLLRSVEILILALGRQNLIKIKC